MKYIKKPIPIEAVKCTYENRDEVESLLESGVTEWEKVLDDDYNLIGYNIHSWEGVDPVYFDPSRNVNKDHPFGAEYFVIKGLKGECYPCIKDDDSNAPLGYELYTE